MSTTIRLSEEIEKRLEMLSQKTGRSKSFHIREIIENNIDDCEEYYLSEQVLVRIRRGTEKKHNVFKVKKVLKLTD